MPHLTAPPDLRETLARLAADPDYVDLAAAPDLGPRLVIDLKYATVDNFVGRDVYGPFRRAFLRREAADRLRHAAAVLHAERPDLRFRVFDALRPRSVQRILHAFVAGTTEERYVANPDRGSMHNYGCAIDLTLTDPQGLDLDMGTAFDAFDVLSEPRREPDFLASGRLHALQLENRQVLRRAMTGGGFLQLPHEWWHFNAFSETETRTRFPIIE